MDNRTRVFLQHILDNITKIESFSKGMTKEDLVKNELVKYAIVRAMEIIGEAAKNIPESFKKENPSIMWREIIGTRDIMIHKYFGVDLGVIWNIITIDLPELKKKLRVLLKK